MIARGDLVTEILRLRSYQPLHCKQLFRGNHFVGAPRKKIHWKPQAREVTQQVGDALPILEQMGYEVTTFKVTWGLPPKARLRLKSNGNSDIQKVNAVAAKATSGGVLVTALITSAATAKRIQSTMKLGTAYLDVDFAVPPRVNMKFVSLKANEKEELPRDTDDLEINCK